MSTTKTVKEPKPPKIKEFVPIEIDVPARMLLVGHCAGQSEGRYSFAAVHVEIKGGFLRTAATDGRSLLIARCPAPKDAPEQSMLVPSKLVPTIIGAIGRKEKNKIVKVRQISPDFALGEASGLFGSISYRWKPIEGVFPPVEDVVGDLSNSKGVGAIDLSPERLAQLIAGVRKVVRDTDGFVKIRLPETTNRPVAVEASFGSLDVIGVLMPMLFKAMPQKIASRKSATAA